MCMYSLSYSFFLIFDRVYLHSPACPGIYYVYQTGIKLTEICLPLLPQC